MTPLKKYIWLVDTVMKAGNVGLTLQQIADAYYFNDDINGGRLYSDRTFHRHREEIKDIFGIEIECYVSGGVYRYRIADRGKNGYFRQWLLNSIAVNRIVMDSQELAQYIAIEESHTDPLPAILQAMKEMRMMKFDYSPYWRDSVTHYTDFRPHALKMFERRWYLIGYYGSDKEHRIYALDRITNCELQEDTFRRNPKFNLEKMFSGSYGIIVEDIPVQSVWLKVDAYQANYLRSLPLHSSQIELERNDVYSKFALRVRPTYDFKQKILSLGATVEVLKPETLRADIKGELNEMLNKYCDDND